MSVTKEKVQDLIKEFGKNDNDSGATESQVAVITERIRNITSHLKNNKIYLYRALWLYTLLHQHATSLIRQNQNQLD